MDGFVHVCMKVYMYAWRYVCMHTCLRLCMYVRMEVCGYVFESVCTTRSHGPDHASDAFPMD